MAKYDELILKMMLQNNGYLHISQLEGLGYDRFKAYPSIKSLGLTKVARGVYCFKNMKPDKMFLICSRASGVILSHESSAFLHHLLLEEPDYVSVTIPHGYNTRHLTERWVIPYQIGREWFGCGKMYMDDNYGNRVCTYNPERTICDFIHEERYLRQKGNLFVDEAIRNYFSYYKKRNIPLLMDYAERLNIRRKAENYLRKYEKEEG